MHVHYACAFTAKRPFVGARAGDRFGARARGGSAPAQVAERELDLDPGSGVTERQVLPGQVPSKQVPPKQLLSTMATISMAASAPRNDLETSKGVHIGR